MAVPSYTTDLTTIAIGDMGTDAGTWSESSDGGWDTGGAMVDDGNLYYNGMACISAQLTKDSNGTGASGPATIMYEHTAAFTIPADGAALMHHLWAAPPALNSIDNATSAGITVLAGSGLGDFYGWDASGSDFAPAPKGGWANYAINPAIGTPDHTVGTVTTYTTIGIGVAATAQARGNPNACNAIRYGRCTSIFENGQTDDYATFLGYSLIDSAIDNKWNLVDPVDGSYKIQGLMSLGTSGTAVDFRDANSNIGIINTINVTSAFNAIEVHNINSNIEWTAISITALGTVSKGTFEVVDNADVLKNSCTFTDMDWFKYLSNSAINNSTYRRCGLITQGSAPFTGCTFDEPSGAVGLLVDSLDDITDCTFNSDGTGHAVNLGTITTNTSVAWDNTDSGYAATNGSTGNETILVSVDNGITLTINVSDTASTPTYYNTGTGTVSVVTGQKTFTFTISPSLTDYEYRIYSVTALGSLTGSVELQGVEQAQLDSYDYAYTYTVDTPIAVQIIGHDNDYVEAVEFYTLKNADQSVSINLSVDNNN